MNLICARVQAKGQVTIPKGIREKLKITPGDIVVFIETKEGVLVKPAVVVTEDQMRQEVAAAVGSIQQVLTDYSPEEIDALVGDAIQKTSRRSS